MLDKLLNPRWKHKNPQVRKRALQTLDPQKDESQKIYREIVDHDPELFIRRFAIQKLNNVGQLQELRDAETHNEIYQEATSRLCELLSTVSKHRPLSYLKNQVANIAENQILEYVAIHANNEELQSLAIEKTVNESVLLEVLNTSSYEKCKQHALNNLNSANSLKRAVKLLKRKNKDLASQAQQRLDSLQQQSEASAEHQKEAKRAAAEFLELVSLCKFSNEWEKYEDRLRHSRERYLQLISNLAQQRSQVDPTLSRQVEEAFSQFEEQLTESRQAKLQEDAWSKDSPDSEPEEGADWIKQGKNIVDDLLALSEQAALAEPGSIDSTADQTIQKARQIESAWSSLFANSDRSQFSSEQTAVVVSLTEQFETAWQNLQQKIELVKQVKEWLSSVEPLNIQAKTLLDSGDAFDLEHAADVLSRYRATSVPESSLVPVDVANEVRETIKQLDERKSAIEKELENLSQEFEELLPRLAAALENGKAKSVKQYINRGRKILKQLPGRYRFSLDRKGASKKFNRLVRDADPLLDWQQWSSSAAREKMVADMEHLVDLVKENSENTDFDFPSVAAKIREARAQWKKMSSGIKGRDDPLWDKFDAVCNQAYEPCQVYFDRQNETRTENLQQRQNLCEDLEQFIESLKDQSSDKVNWKRIDKIVRLARQEWEGLGEVHHKERSKVNGRFYSAVKQLEKKLRQHREDNKKEKQQLIGRVDTALKQLKENAIELSAAVDIVKNSQAQWKNIGAASKDRQLWEKFRALCNSVYELKNEQQQQTKQQEAELDKQRENIIREIIQLTELDGETLPQMRSQLEQLQQQWRDLPGHKKNHPRERRFHQACSTFDRKVKQLHKDRLRDIKQLIQQNLAACYRLEHQINGCIQGHSDIRILQDELVTIEERWHNVDEKSLSFSVAIDKRFENAKSLIRDLTDHNADSIMQNLAEKNDLLIRNKEDLCIQLEILANRQSPESSKQRRLELQVSQLANSMKQSSRPDVELQLQSLLSQWHTSGFILPPESEQFERRFYSALESIDKDYQYPIQA